MMLRWPDVYKLSTFSDAACGGRGVHVCVAAGLSQQYGVVMAGGLAALLCLAGLAAPLPRGAVSRHPLTRFFRQPEAEADPLVETTLADVSHTATAVGNEGGLVDQMLAQGR